MDEVVVIGYGTAKKAALTSSVETISGDELLKIPAMNVDQTLAGQVAGLGVMSTTGDPSSAKEAEIHVRGNIGAPLLVIDGVPRLGTNTTDGEMRLSDLNPDDIESVSILKDALLQPFTVRVRLTVWCLFRLSAVIQGARPELTIAGSLTCRKQHICPSF